jgi:NAD(P)-dependent dehydrogenase (short-subunit alcohol dehydrogenase family)
VSAPRRSVLITGASSGIGAAIAGRLAARGFRVFGTSRHPERLQRKPAERARSQAGPSAGSEEWVALDVCDDDSVRKCVEQAGAAAGGLDAAVLNAGFGIFGSVEEVSIEQAKAQFETNFFGVLRMLRALLPPMREARRGRIVLVGSLAGRAPIPFQAHYSASKAAVDSLALALRNEVDPYGIGVSLVEPGDIDTGFNDAMDWGDPSASPYGERIRRCETVIRESLPKAPGPDAVARVVEKALTARRPRVRYPVGPDSRLVPLGRRLLPDRWSLALIRSHFRI